MPLAQEDVTIDPAVIAGVLTRIYQGRYGKSGDKGIDRRLFEATHEVFNLATASGIAEAVNRGVPAPSAQFLELLDRNNAIFSAFRTHKMQTDVASLLLDDKGKIKKFANFKRDVTPVIGKYNGAWLRTEYATAVQRSRLATKWQQFVDESDVFPNLEWVQSTALHPGEDHRIFWFTVRPVDDPFWSHHRPGDRWNCQCDLRQTDLPPTDIPTIPIGDAANSPAPGLDNNPGTDGVIFNDHHPYFPKNCTTCPFANMGKKLIALAGITNNNCHACQSAANAINQSVDTLNAQREAAKEAYKRIKQEIINDFGLSATFAIAKENDNCTGILKLSKDSVKSILKAYKHSRTIESKEAFLFALRNPNILSYEHSEELGDGKDMNNEEDRLNIQMKQQRGVVRYNIYTFTYNGKMWALGVEYIKKGSREFEQPYFISERHE